MKTQNPIIGRAKGQAGGMVACTLFGKNILRAKPFEYRDKNSEAQQLVREKMQKKGVLMGQMKFFAHELFETPPTGMSAFSKIGSQIKSIFTGTLGALTFNPKDVVVGSGSIPDVRDFAFVAGTTGQLDLSWDDTVLYEDEDADDELYVLITNAAGNKAAYITTGAVRSAGHVSIVVPAMFEDEAVFAGPKFKGGNDLATKVKMSTTEIPVDPW